MNTELVVFIVYLCFMLGIGVYFFVKGRGSGEKEYFLGGRKMGPWVSALSAGASDMSAWVLMGLPASIYAAGIGKAWIAIGLAIGYALSWIFQAPRLRRFSIAADDSITLPQYLTNRFKSSSKVLQILCAVIFLIAYTIYAASSVKACGTLFNTVIGIDATLAMYIAAAIIIGYTFMGGFSAVCWTDFFQGLLMLGALLIAPIFALGLISGGQGQMDMETLSAANPRLEDDRFRPRLGSRILRYASHHHPFHVRPQRYGPAQEREDRYFLDCADCHLLRGCRLHRTSVPW